MCDDFSCKAASTPTLRRPKPLYEEGRFLLQSRINGLKVCPTDSYLWALTGYFLKILATPLLIGLDTVLASARKSALGARCNTSVIVPRKTTRSLLRSNRSITSVPVVTSHMFIVALPTIPL